MNDKEENQNLYYLEDEEAEPGNGVTVGGVTYHFEKVSTKNFNILRRCDDCGLAYIIRSDIPKKMKEVDRGICPKCRSKRESS